MAYRSAVTVSSWDQEVSDVDVLDIVDTYKLDDVYYAGIRLGLTDKDAADNKLSDIHNPKKQAMNFLNLWRNRKGGAATRRVLTEAFKECPNSTSSLQKMERKWKMSPEKKKAVQPHVNKPKNVNVQVSEANREGEDPPSQLSQGSSIKIQVDVDHSDSTGAERVADAIIAITNSSQGKGEVLLRNKTKSSAPSEKFIQSLDDRMVDIDFTQPIDYTLPFIGHTVHELTINVHPHATKKLLHFYKEGKIWGGKWGAAHTMYTGSVRPIRKTEHLIHIFNNQEEPPSIPPLPNTTSYKEGAVIPLEEGISTEFKHFTGQDVDKQIKNEVNKYASGFANTVGGRIIFGVDDKSREIRGVKLQSDSLTLSSDIEQKLKQLFWLQVKSGKLTQLKQDEIRRDAQFIFQNFKVAEANGKYTDRCVFVLTVNRLKGGVVFTKPPTCPIYDDCRVRQASVDEWCNLASAYLK